MDQKEFEKLLLTVQKPGRPLCPQRVRRGGPSRPPARHMALSMPARGSSQLGHGCSTLR